MAGLSAGNCRARLKLGQERFVCVDGPQWERWLAHPGAPCGGWSGHWRAHSPLLNDPGHGGKAIELDFVNEGPVPAEPNGIWSVLAAIERIRAHASHVLEPHDPDGVARTLLLGERAGDLAALPLLGFVHVLAATGIHLYALAFLVSWLACRSGLPLRRATRLRTAAVISVWTLAWLVCGARPGMLRPWIALTLRAGGRMLGLRWAAFGPLVAAVLTEAIVSRQGSLTYALAVGGGLLCAEGGHLGLALGSWAATALLELRDVHLISPLTPLWSLISIPLYATAIYPPLLFGALMRWDWPMIAASELNRALVAHAFGLLWQVPLEATIAGVALTAIGVAARVRARWGWAAGALILGTRAVLPGLVSGPVVTDSRATVEQLDVGQGDSALVRSRDGRVGLIDTGSERALDAVRWTLLLAARDIRHVDWILLTHLDEDHRGGIAALSHAVPIGCVAVTPGELASERGRDFARKLTELHVRLASTEGDCVPYPHWEAPGARKNNSHMAALWIPLDPHGVYFSAGDADAEDEAYFARRLREDPAWPAYAEQVPRIFKVSHHGSRNSGSPELLAVFRPTQAWISDGVGNRYGHPAVSTLRRLGALCPIRRTDELGSLGPGEPLKQ